MNDTREKILLAALELFAADGYEAVSVSQIAGKLDMTKGTLYRHYQNKRDIFDSILRRMEEEDAQQARAHSVPEDTLAEGEAAYQAVMLDSLFAFAKAQFAYWTQDAFASAFRRMLTLEQHRSPEMGALFQQYLGAGPLGYTRDLLSAMGYADAQQKAMALYAPMFLGYSLYDGGEANAGLLLQSCFERLQAQWQIQQTKGRPTSGTALLHPKWSKTGEGDSLLPQIPVQAAAEGNQNQIAFQFFLRQMNIA